MGRKPKLTPHQEREVQQRIAAGETQRSVARSYDVSQGTIQGFTKPNGCGREALCLYCNG